MFLEFKFITFFSLFLFFCNFLHKISGSVIFNYFKKNDRLLMIEMIKEKKKKKGNLIIFFEQFFRNQVIEFKKKISSQLFPIFCLGFKY